MRRWVTFLCEDVRLTAAIDDAGGTRGVLVVSGGNEILCGSHGGMASLAEMLVRSGISVFRYDRRGVGDSEGENRGFLSSSLDIQAALQAFRAECPTITTVAATGNCDGATALAIFACDIEVDTLVLTNCWLRDERDALPSAAAIRGRYADKLKNPKEWMRLLTGAVDVKKLAGGVRKALFPPKPEPGMEYRIARGVGNASCPILLLNASRDATAMVFSDALQTAPLSQIINQVSIQTYDSNSHSFAGENDLKILHDALLHTFN